MQLAGLMKVPKAYRQTAIASNERKVAVMTLIKGCESYKTQHSMEVSEMQLTVNGCLKLGASKKLSQS